VIVVLRRTDQWLTASRPGWLWMGQLAVVILGIHLAADRLDDYLFVLLSQVPVAWPDPALPATASTLTGLAVELMVAVRATWILLSSAGGPEPSWHDWWEKRSVESFVRPLFWAVMALSGAWVVGMGVEDVTAPLWAPLGRVLGWTAAGLTAWRLGWSGWKRTTGGLFIPKRRRWGLVWAPILALVTLLALVDGLPLWGWL